MASTKAVSCISEFGKRNKRLSDLTRPSLLSLKILVLLKLKDSLTESGSMQRMGKSLE